MAKLPTETTCGRQTDYEVSEPTHRPALAINDLLTSLREGEEMEMIVSSTRTMIINEIYIVILVVDSVFAQTHGEIVDIAYLQSVI